MKPIFIAEIKTQSPFGFKSPHTFVELMEKAIAYGDWVSVHTNALWGGDYDAISFVRRNTGKTILAKGLHTTDDDIQRALDHGADYVLTVDHVPYKPELRDKCLLEIHNIHILEWNLEHTPYFKSQKFVINSRDLRYGTTSNKYDLLASYGILDKMKWTCQASGIRTVADVRHDVQAFIVGEHLMDFCDYNKL